MTPSLLIFSNKIKDRPMGGLLFWKPIVNVAKQKPEWHRSRGATPIKNNRADSLSVYL